VRCGEVQIAWIMTVPLYALGGLSVQYIESADPFNLLGFETKSPPPGASVVGFDTSRGNCSS